MKYLVIPHLPKYSTRGFEISKNLGGAHFIVWSMPFPFTVNNLLDNLFNSLLTSKFKKDGVVVHKVARLPFFFPPINKWLFKIQIKKIFNDNNIDTIISESYFNETEPPLELPLVYDLVDDHEAFIDIYGSNIYKLGCKILQVSKTIEKQIRKSKLVVTVSNILVSDLTKKGIVATKIPNGVSKKFLDYKKENTSFKKNSLVYVSNFDSFSNLTVLIRAVNILFKKYPDITLKLVGDGVETDRAKKLVKSLNLSKVVEFCGWLESSSIPKILSSSEICLIPFKKDKLTNSAFPIKVLEYLACGNKIVSSDLDEVRNIKSPNIYIYKDSNDYSALSKSISCAIRNKFIKNINRSIAKEYSWKKIGKTLKFTIEHVK